MQLLARSGIIMGLIWLTPTQLTSKEGRKQRQRRLKEEEEEQEEDEEEEEEKKN
jgi:hypothetical protein